jgi:hypothetical protein
MKPLLNKPSDNLLWKCILVLQLIFTALDIDRMLNEPAILQPTHPFYVSIIVFVIDQLVLFANIGVVMRFYILRVWFWQLVLFTQPIILAITLYFEFSSGGYSFNDMLIYVNFGVIILFVFLLPVAKYCNEIKKIEI